MSLLVCRICVTSWCVVASVLGLCNQLLVCWVGVTSCCVVADMRVCWVCADGVRVGDGAVAVERVCQLRQRPHGQRHGPDVRHGALR